MPLLERTAASLEPCNNLRRALPSTASSRNGRRQLHNAFWHHGAADIELSTAWQALMHGPFHPADLSPTVVKQTGSMTASTFLLDFLYPYGARNTLRRLSPAVLERYEIPPLPSRPHVPRLYSSSASLAGQAPQTCSTRPEPLTMREPKSLLDVEASELIPEEIRNENSPANRTYASQGSTETNPSLGTLSVGGLRDLLERNGDVPFDRAWKLYTSLDGESKAVARATVIVHLGRSSRPIDAWRILELFPTLNHDEWDENVVAAAIGAELILDRFSEAESIFKEALDSRGLVHGLDLILAYAVKVSAWDNFVNAWGYYLQTFVGPKRCPNFIRVATIPNLVEKFSELYQYLDQSSCKVSPSIAKGQLEAFMRLFCRCCLAQLEPPAALFVLEHANYPPQYKYFIFECLHKGQNALAAQVYKKYRALPGVQSVNRTVLENMINVFNPHDPEGMRLVLKDFYRRYDRLSRNSYRKFLTFFADRGDVKSVYRMWDEYTKHYPNVIATKSDTFTFPMHVHAVRGEVSDARRVFDEISSKYHRVQPLACWNILLNAHVKAKDFDGALDLFRELCEKSAPDRYSFSTIIRMAGLRGDLELSLELYHMMLAKGIKPASAMLTSLVSAYCQNDQLREAEASCLAMTRRMKGQEGKCTPIWNVLLSHQARMRDLDSVHHLLQEMNKLNVPYDSETYDNLLLSLVNCRQSHHALHLVRVAQAEGVFQVEPKHFILLMAGFLRTREPHLALKVSDMMTQLNMPHPAHRMSMVLTAISRWRQMPSHMLRQRKPTEFLGQALREFHNALAWQRAEQSRGRQPTTAAEVESSSELYARMILVLTQFRDFATVREIMELYNQAFPQQAGPERLDWRLLSSLMLADFYDGEHERVRESWAILFARAKTEGSSTPLSSGRERRVLPAYRYALCDALKTTQRVYVHAKDTEGLTQLIRTVLDEGFLLDSKNWNFYVQGLARLQNLKEAFAVCERRLMPNWTGWYEVRRRTNLVDTKIPLLQRRMGSAPQHPRPVSYTLIVLAKEYLNLKQVAPWSREASKLFSQMNEQYPRTTKAVTTMLRSGSLLERDIFSGAEAERLACLFEPGIYDSGGMDVIEDAEMEDDPLGLQEGNTSIDNWRRNSLLDENPHDGNSKDGDDPPKQEKSHLSSEQFENLMRGDGTDDGLK